MKIRIASRALFIGCLLVFAAIAELNGAPQIWMSGTGDDANPGSRTAPVLTLPAALAKVNVNGQITVLDPGNYYSVDTPVPIVVPQAVVIEGTSMPAEILLNTPGTGIMISAGPTDTVILRHLTLNGTGLATTGIQFVSGFQLIIEDCDIIGFTGTGIDINLTNAGNVIIKNTSIGNVATGVSVNGMAVPVSVSADNLTIQATTSAVHALLGSVDITNSFILQNTTGVIGGGTSIVSCSNTLFASNSTAIQSVLGATVQISNNDFYDNTTGIDNTGGGDVATANNNREAGSTTPGSPTSSIVYQ